MDLCRLKWANMDLCGLLSSNYWTCFENLTQFNTTGFNQLLLWNNLQSNFLYAPFLVGRLYWRTNELFQSQIGDSQKDVKVANFAVSNRWLINHKVDFRHSRDEFPLRWKKCVKPWMCNELVADFHVMFLPWIASFDYLPHLIRRVLKQFKHETK